MGAIAKDYYHLLKLATQNEKELILEFQDINSPTLALKRNSKGQTLLHIAAGFGKYSVVKDLIERGADVNAQHNEGEAPLHNSCNHCHRRTTELLLRKGADVNLQDNRGWTPLHWALVRRERTDSFFSERIRPEYMEIVDLLIDYGADPYIKSFKHGRDSLALVGNENDRRRITYKFLSRLIQQADSREESESIINKYFSVSEFFELIKEGDENLDFLEFITTKKLAQSRLSESHSSPLHRAAGYNQLETAKHLIKMGSSVSATDDYDCIPLHNAAKYGHIQMIELLVSEGSDINSQDYYGCSPLHEAALANETFAACLKLLELGADANLACNRGLRPYQLAKKDDVRYILQPKATFRQVPSSSDQGIYLVDSTRDISQPVTLPSRNIIDSELRDLMLDTNSKVRLFSNTSHTIKKIPLRESDSRYQKVKQQMLKTIKAHDSDNGGEFDTYEILRIDELLHEKVWHKYRLGCERLELEYGEGSKNETLLFHGSNFIGNIETNGFDERYAQRNGMFGAGIYFAEHSSKSNQYTFGWGQGCQRHKDKSCYTCERKMILAQVALGRSLISKIAMPECAHAPPGYSSVTGLPGITEDLKYPEYVIYSGDQAYPRFLIEYRIKDPRL